jgi:Domain of unknown function (DUF4760)
MAQTKPNQYCLKLDSGSTGVRMSVTDIIATIATAINFAALIFLGAQVMQARRAMDDAAKGQEQEWDRQRKKASLDALVATQEYRASLKASLPWNDRDPSNVAAFLEEAKEDHEKLALVRRYLNSLEDLAIGVKQGVYDLEIIYLSEGERITTTVENYQPYIQGIREELKSQLVYNEINDLANMLKAFRAKLEIGSDHDDSRKLSGHRAHLAPEFLIKGLKGKLNLNRTNSVGTAHGEVHAEGKGIVQQ